MEIRISLDRVEPPAGRLWQVPTPAGQEIPFTGWLGLLRALVAWAVIRLLGVELTVEAGSGTTQVGAVDVLLASLVAGLAAWGVYALLAHWGRPRWWPSVGSIALALSMLGPSYLADGISAFSLICLHILVAVVLITGFARFIPLPWQADYRSSRG